MPKKKLNLSLDTELDRRIEKLMELTGTDTKAEFFNYAAALYEWAISEVEAGRSIASIDEDSRQMKELEMPPLRRLKERSKEE